MYSEAARGGPPVAADADPLKKVAVNRCHNAAQFSLNQFGANILRLLFRNAGFADEVIH